MRPAASFAASVLLSCALAPAHAHQPPSPHPGARTAPGARAGAKASPECKRLRAAIVESEQSERRLGAAMMESVQQDLLILRKRYRKLGCRAAPRI